METNLKRITPFPSPQWVFNSHVHTIACSFLGDTKQPDSVKRIIIPTPDKDFLELDVYKNPGSKAVITLFHGLEGSTDRYYMVELMKELIEEDYSVVAVNFRSCGSKMNRQRRFYHSGETRDYETIFDWVREHFPDQNMGAVGFSLGGNALLKSLAEKGEAHPADTAVAVSVPYDLRMGAIMLSQGFHRVYEYQFLKTLKQKLDEKKEQFSDLPNFSGSTLYDFDDQITAPLHGFKDADEYYEQCSGRRFVDDIKTRTLLVHSREDPLCPIQAMPVAKVYDNDYTDYIITEKGGHVGFWSRPRGWLNYVIRKYLGNNLTD